MSEESTLAELTGRVLEAGDRSELDAQEWR
jgi:hypothetical protein